MPELYDVKITKVYEGKKGESQHGPWTAYNFYIDDSDWKDQKFGYFQSGKKPVPAVGMVLGKLEYKVEEKDGYTNYSVSKLEVKPETEKPVPQTKAPAKEEKTKPDQRKEATKPVPVSDSGSDRYLSMYMAYAKDLMVAMLPFSKKLQKCELDEICRFIARGGLILQTSAHDAERIEGQERQKILVAEIKEICSLANLQVIDVKQWLNQTKTFENKIGQIWGNLSLHQTPSKVLESIISISEKWLPLAKEALAKKPDGKSETGAEKTGSSSDKTTESEPEIPTDAPGTGGSPSDQNEFPL